MMLQIAFESLAELDGGNVPILEMSTVPEPGEEGEVEEKADDFDEDDFDDDFDDDFEAEVEEDEFGDLDEFGDVPDPAV